MAFRPLSVISAVRQPGDTEDMAEERAKVANANYIATRHWEAVVGSRRLCAQVSRDHAEMQSELRRSAQKIRVLEQELVALNAEHKGLMFAYASVEGSSCNIENHLRQEIEAADMQRSNMQQFYKKQLHEQQGLVAELRTKNEFLMEDKAALTEEVARLRRQLNIVQSSRATPTGPASMGRSPFGSSIGGTPSASSADRPASGVAYISGADAPMSSSSVASHSSDVFDRQMEDWACLSPITQELSRGPKFVQTTRATPAGPANMVTLRGAPITSQHFSSPLEVEASPAELNAGATADTSSSPSPSSSSLNSISSAFPRELPSPLDIVKALTAMGTSPESPKATPLVNGSQRPALANLTNRLTPQARVTPKLAASAQTPGKATPPTSAAGRHLSALLQRSSLGSPSPCPRPRTSPPRVVVTGSRSATSTRSNCGSEASPGTPPALDLLSPARALSNRPRAVGRFSMALPSDAVVRAVGTQLLSPTVPFRTLVSSPTAPSPPRPVSSNPRGSLLGARAFGYTPTAPFAEPPVSMHSLESVADQRFSHNLSLPEAQGPTPYPAVRSAVTISSAAVPLQLTPVQQPLQAHGPSARSVAASNGRTRSVPSSAVSSGKASRRSSISKSIAVRPAWSATFSRSSGVHTRLTEDMTPVSRRLTTASPHRAASSPQPSPSPVRAVAGSPAVEPSSVQAMRRTGSNAAAARLMSTAKTGVSTRTAAHPSAVKPTAAQPNAGRAAVQGNSRAARAAPTRAGPAALAAQRPATLQAIVRSSKAAASTPAGQSVAKHREATSGRSDVVQSETGPAPVPPRQASMGNCKAREVRKKAPIRTQPARQAKDPGHVWRF